MLSAARAVLGAGHTNGVPAMAGPEVTVIRRRLLPFSSINPDILHNTGVTAIVASPRARVPSTRLGALPRKYLLSPAAFPGPMGRTGTAREFRSPAAQSDLGTRIPSATTPGGPRKI